MSSNYESVDATTATLFFGLVLFIIFISLIMYVLNGIALSKIASKVGYDKPWFAWIPILNGFLMPILVEKETHEAVRGKFVLIFGVLYVISLFFSPLAVITAAMSTYAFYIICSWFSSNAVVHTIIAVFTFGISMPISLLRFRNREVKKVAF